MSIADYEVIREKLREQEVFIRGERYYVAETDLLLDDAQLIEHARVRAAALDHPNEAPPNQGFVDEDRRLLAIAKDGRIVRWKDGFVLTYAITKESFAKKEYDAVRQNMRVATGAWAGVCGIRFEYREAFDRAPAGVLADVVFTVSKEDTKGRLIAAAFFPTDPPKRRSLVIDPSYFSPTLGFDSVGVLRHELGHVLGFRHEHIREGAPRGCLREELDSTAAVTKYDSKSVMHYLCGGLGSPTLEITDIDRAGAQTIYGPPLASFEFVS